MRSRPTAGQATIEYLAAIALLAVVFLVAAPAVGAPSIGRSVAGQIKHGICLVGGDFCTNSDARRAGLLPCPLRSETTGGEAAVTFLIAEVGGKWLLSVTPLSDGTVSVIRTLAASGALSAGGFGIDAGPVRVDGDLEATVRTRIQGAVGWIFPNRATADRFLEHSVRNGVDVKRWPSTWQSGELGSEVAASAGIAVGKRDVAGGRLGGASASGQLAIGVKRFRDGSLTTYSRMTLDRGEVSVPFLTPIAHGGRSDWVVELTREKSGRLRELVLRDTTLATGGKQVAETVARLDLRDPGNLAVARSLIDSPIPWTMPGGSAKQAVLDRIATHGSVETAVSEVEDQSRGASVKVKLGVKLGFSGKRIKVVRRLVEATARAGRLDGRRLDCLPEPRRG